MNRLILSQKASGLTLVTVSLLCFLSAPSYAEILVDHLGMYIQGLFDTDISLFHNQYLYIIPKGEYPSSKLIHTVPIGAIQDIQTPCLKMPNGTTWFLTQKGELLVVNRRGEKSLFQDIDLSNTRFVGAVTDSTVAVICEDRITQAWIDDAGNQHAQPLQCSVSLVRELRGPVSGSSVRSTPRLSFTYERGAETGIVCFAIRDGLVYQGRRTFSELGFSEKAEVKDVLELGDKGEYVAVFGNTKEGSQVCILNNLEMHAVWHFNQESIMAVGLVEQTEEDSLSNKCVLATRDDRGLTNVRALNVANKSIEWEYENYLYKAKKADTMRLRKAEMVGRILTPRRLFSLENRKIRHISVRDSLLIVQDGINSFYRVSLKQNSLCEQIWQARLPGPFKAISADVQDSCIYVFVGDGRLYRCCADSVAWIQAGTEHLNVSRIASHKGHVALFWPPGENGAGGFKVYPRNFRGHSVMAEASALEEEVFEKTYGHEIESDIMGDHIIWIDELRKHVWAARLDGTRENFWPRREDLHIQSMVIDTEGRRIFLSLSDGDFACVHLAEEGKIIEDSSQDSYEYLACTGNAVLVFQKSQDNRPVLLGVLKHAKTEGLSYPKMGNLRHREGWFQYKKIGGNSLLVGCEEMGGAHVYFGVTPIWEGNEASKTAGLHTHRFDKGHPIFVDSNYALWLDYTSGDISFWTGSWNKDVMPDAVPVPDLINQYMDQDIREQMISKAIVIDSLFYWLLKDGGLGRTRM